MPAGLTLLALVAGLCLTLPSTAAASVAYFKKGCPVALKAERVKPIDGKNRKQVSRVLRTSRFRVGKRVVRIRKNYNWRKGRRTGLTKKAASLQFLKLTAAASDNKVTSPKHGFNRRQRRAATRKVVAIAASFARASNHGQLLRGDAHKPRIVALRVPMLAYAGKAGACRGAISLDEARAIKKALVRDMQRLGQRVPKFSPINHKVTVAVGRLLASRHLRHDPRARRLGRGSLPALRRHLLRAYQRNDGTWLEHSPEYHRLAYSIIENFRRNIAPGDKALRSAARRLKQSLGWFVLHDNSLVQWGSTSRHIYGMRAVRKSPGRKQGWRPARRSGFVTYSDRQKNWFGLTSQFHFRAHKHHDEGSFDLVSRGRRVVLDTGRWGPGKYRGTEKSARSHSTLLVDGRAFNTELKKRPYGSSVLAVGRGEGWYASQSRNPLLVAPKGLSRLQKSRRPAKKRQLRRQFRRAAKRDAAHTRIALYNPNRALVIIDRVRSKSDGRRYDRLVQLAPGVRYSNGNLFFSGRAIPLTSRVGSGEIQLPAVNPSAPYFPAKRKLVKRERLTFRSHGKNVDHVMVFGLDGRIVSADIVGGQVGARHAAIVLRDRRGAPIDRIEVIRKGARLNVVSPPLGLGDLFAPSG